MIERFGKRHVRTPECTDDCFGCKSQGIVLGKVDTTGQSRFERQMDKDVKAYKRLRHDGLQPKGVKGAAELESRAASKFEVESGINLGGNSKAGKQYDEIQGIIQAGGAV